MALSDTLPRPGGARFLIDGGLETCLIFGNGIELPSFASFVLLDSAEGLDALRAYYGGFLDIAAAHGSGFVLDSPTWRASPDWGAVLGYDLDRLDRANRRAIGLLQELRDERGGSVPMAINATIRAS